MWFLFTFFLQNPINEVQYHLPISENEMKVISYDKLIETEKVFLDFEEIIYRLYCWF
jgi:hypothetical protein